MNRFKTLALLGILFGTFATAQAQTDPNRVVATVNGEEIRGPEYYRRMEFLPGVGKQTGQVFSEFPPGFLTIEQLITERLIIQLAKAKGVLPNENDVQSEFALRLADTPDILTNWLAGGRTTEELKQQIKIELAQFRIASFGVTITDQQVEQDYEKSKSRYTTPKRYKLRVILLKDSSKKDKVDADLIAGKKFGDTAALYSDDISRLRGGEYGIVPVEALATTVAEALKTVKIGSTTPWLDLKLGDGTSVTLKFFLEDTYPEIVAPLDGKLRRAIRQRLAVERGRAQNDISSQMKAARTKAAIDIKQPEFAEAYKKFIEGYLKQQAGGG